MKNLLLSILVLVGTINYDKVLAAVKIPKVGFITKIISKNITSKALSKRSVSDQLFECCCYLWRLLIQVMKMPAA